MSKFTDQEYLSTEQYRDASNLDARAQLHERFSTNKYGWHRWVYEQYKLAPGSRILELGCGPAYLWRENADRIPAGWDLTLTDFSPGMVQQARQSLRGGPHLFRYGVADAQAIPFEDARFDVVIANHMLYHVPDRARALSEIRRVLRPGGRFYAATNGQSHMRELKELTGRFAPDAGLAASSSAEFFGLEDGRDEIARWFSEVTVHRYKDALIVTEAEPLIAYVRSLITAAQPSPVNSPPAPKSAHRVLRLGERSGSPQDWGGQGGPMSHFHATGCAPRVHRTLRVGNSLGDDQWTALAEFVERALAAHGAIHITKDPGLFEAW